MRKSSESLPPASVLILYLVAAAAAKSLQSCPILCDPIDRSPPGSPVPGILQARTMEWVAISFSNAWKWEVKGKLLSRVRLLATPWTTAYQAPPSMGFSRQEYWSGVPLPSPLYLVRCTKRKQNPLNHRLASGPQRGCTCPTGVDGWVDNLLSKEHLDQLYAAERVNFSFQ